MKCKLILVLPKTHQNAAAKMENLGALPRVHSSPVFAKLAYMRSFAAAAVPSSTMCPSFL